MLDSVDVTSKGGLLLNAKMIFCLVGKVEYKLGFRYYNKHAINILMFV